MPKILIVAEKPSAGKDIAAALLSSPKPLASGFLAGELAGCEVVVCWLKGHLLQLVKFEGYDEKYERWCYDDLPFIPENWKFKSEPTPREFGGDPQLLNKVIQLFKHLSPGDEVVNACDAGREGELIFRKTFVFGNAHAVRGLKLSRMWAQKNTKAGLLEAFDKRKSSSHYDGLGLAASCREQADWFFGLNMTRLVSLSWGESSGLGKTFSIGRVQTPTLALIVARDEAIADFVPSDYWEVYADFPSGRGKAVLEPFYMSPQRATLLGLPPEKYREALKDMRVFWSKTLAEQFVLFASKAQPFRVKDAFTLENHAAPLPFSLIEAQKLGSKLYKWTASKTLKLLQRLYDEFKLVSYPRTDSRYFPSDYGETLYHAMEAVWTTLAKAGLTKRLGVLPLPPKDSAIKAKCFDDKGVTDHYALCPTEDMSHWAAMRSDKDADELTLCYLMLVTATVKALDATSVSRVTERIWKSESKSSCEFKAKTESVHVLGWKRWEADGSAGAKFVDLPNPPLENAKDFEVMACKTSPPSPYTEETLLTAMEHAYKFITDKDAGLTDMTAADAIELMAKAEKGLGTPATRADIIEKLVAYKYIKRTGVKLQAEEKGSVLVKALRERTPDVISPAKTASWENDMGSMEKDHPVQPAKRVEFLNRLLSQFESAKTAFPAPAFGGSTRVPSPKTASAPTSTGVMCPLSGKPIMDFGMFYLAEGLKDVKLYKVVAMREITLGEYERMLGDFASGRPVLVHGFKSKTGKTFSARLVIKAGKVSFDFAST